MQCSELSFRMWFASITFMSFGKKEILAAEILRQLGHKINKTFWAMRHNNKCFNGRVKLSYTPIVLENTKLIKSILGCVQQFMINKTFQAITY